MINFQDFIANLVLEELHPELKAIVEKPRAVGSLPKQAQLAKKIKDLSEKGEHTGIEGNMPKGSSRAYLAHEEPVKIHVDDKPTSMKIGTKVAIKSPLDIHHKGDMKLGNMQNHAENGDYWVNKTYRTLTEHSEKPGHFHTNEDGIFPPLVHADHENHEWSQVGHARSIKKSEFPSMTKTKEFPKGITHDDFASTLERFHNRNNGKHWKTSNDSEKHMDNVETHPLVQKFMDYHGNTGHPPHDYRQINNLGAWKHPVTGKEHIVARDHGFDTEVAHAYSEAQKNKNKGYR